MVKPKTLYVVTRYECSSDVYVFTSKAKLNSFIASRGLKYDSWISPTTNKRQYSESCLIEDGEEAFSVEVAYLNWEGSQ